MSHYITFVSFFAHALKGKNRNNHPFPYDIYGMDFATTKLSKQKGNGII